MPVNTPNECYKLNVDKWRKCRIVAQGEEKVKEAGRVFLPALAEQTAAEYQAYVNRALFYGATGRTVNGLLGAIFRKSPLVSPTDTRTETELHSITQDYQDAESFASNIVYEVLVTGRVGLLVDAPKEEGGISYLTSYQAESIINWQYRNTGDGLVLSLVVLEEEYPAQSNDIFTVEMKKQYRVLELIDNIYQQRVFRGVTTQAGSKEETEFVEVPDMTVNPKVSGRILDYIPFNFINPVDLTAQVYDSPILALANVNLSHYRSSADLEHGRHFTGLPTAWVAGFEKTDTFRIGSQIAWVSDEPDASAGFLEFTGQGLQSLENALKEKQEMMAVLGARMLEDPKKMIESGVALTTRYRGENNILSSVSKTCSSALSQALTWLMEWRGLSKEVEYQLNSDFVNDKLGAQDIKALMETWQAGAISWDTLFFNYKRGEIYPEDVDMDVEQNALETEVDMDTGSFGDNGAIPEDAEDEDEDESKKSKNKKKENLNNGDSK